MNTDTKKFLLLVGGVVLVFVLVGGVSYWSRSDRQQDAPVYTDPSPPIDVPVDRKPPGIQP